MGSTVPDRSELVELTNEFFSRPVCQKGTKPLKKNICIQLQIENHTLQLTKNQGAVAVSEQNSNKVDMSFRVPYPALEHLASLETDNLGEVGIEITKLLLHSDPQKRMIPKVYLGVFDLLRKGYLGVIPLGGATLMKFLASQGFGSIGKIKNALTKLRDTR